MDKPDPEIISLKAQMRDIKEDIRKLQFSMIDIQKRLLKLTKSQEIF